MKTEAEIRAAFDALTWFVDGGRVLRQDFATRMNILGGLAALEWVLGLSRDGNPIAGTLRDIAAMQAGPERN